MKIAISQPTYLPWIGYFDLIDQADTFVFLDSVQFEKRSWQQRNRIKAAGGLCLLTVPVIVKGRFQQSIKDVEIESPAFVRKHLRSIEMNYSRCPFFSRYFPEMSEILETGAARGSLADLNIQLIRWLCNILGIATPTLRSFDLNQTGSRSVLLANLCRSLGADCYLSSLGSTDYLLDDVIQFSSAGIEVVFQNYEHPLYRQQFPPFCSHASVIDLLFNEGESSLEILRDGRRTQLTPADLQVLCHKENAPA